jgi:hypothetical protein
LLADALLLRDATTQLVESAHLSHSLIFFWLRS